MSRPGQAVEAKYLTAFVLLFLFCFLFVSFRQSLFIDEYSTWKIARSPSFTALLERVRTIELKPPLHFVYAGLVVRVLETAGLCLERSAFMLRLSSLPFILIAFLFALKLSVYIFENSSLRLLWLILVFFNPTVFRWSGYFRLYAPFFCLSLVCLVTGFEYLQNPDRQRRSAWLFSVVLSLYTHVFAFLCLAAQLCIFAVSALLSKNRERLFDLFVDCVLISVAFLPQLPGLLYLLGHPPLEMTWNAPFSVFRVLALFVRFHSSSSSGLVVFAVLALAVPLFMCALGKAPLRPPLGVVGYLAWYTVLGLAAGCVMGLAFPYSFHERYLIFLFAPYLALVLSAAALVPTRLRTMLLIGLLGLTLCSSVFDMYKPDDWTDGFLALVSSRFDSSRDLLVYGARLFEAWDYLVINDFYRRRFDPAVIHYLKGKIPFWKGGRYLDDPARVVHGFPASLLKYRRVWFLGRRKGGAELPGFLRSKGYVRAEIHELGPYRALFLFERGAGAPGKVGVK